jgi:plasmid stability protein
MIRTQIQLPEADYERLRVAAQRQGRSMADCIREGVGLYLASTQMAVSDVLALAGRFTPQPAADLNPHDGAWIDEIRLPREP